MTLPEFAAWVAYRNRRGPLNPLLRQDGNFALIASLISQACGGKAEMADFMPWAKDDDQEATVGEVMNLLVGGKRG